MQAWQIKVYFRIPEPNTVLILVVTSILGGGSHPLVVHSHWQRRRYIQLFNNAVFQPCGFSVEDVQPSYLNAKFHASFIYVLLKSHCIKYTLGAPFARSSSQPMVWCPQPHNYGRVVVLTSRTLDCSTFTTYLLYEHETFLVGNGKPS